VKLSNFGFAKLCGVAAQVPTDMNLQIPKGTLGYMAPEQLLGAAITPQTDVYLGALLVRELLVGEPAFVRNDEPYVDYLQAMAEPSLSQIAAVCPGLPRVVTAALQAALQVESEKRRISAVDVQRVLSAHRGEGRAKLNEVLARLELVRCSVAEAEAIETDDSSVTAPSLLRLEARARRARFAALTFALLAFIFGGVAAAFVVRSAGRASLPAIAQPSPVEVAPISPATPARSAEPAMPQTGAPVADAPAPVAHEHSQPHVVDVSPPATPPATTAEPTIAGEPVTTGELQTEASTPPHRVFVDGRLVGESGATFTLSCGEHRVRIGGGGKPQSVTVPCGGNAVVATR
jgi:hypothetical protein